MAGKIDVVLLENVPWVGNKNEMVSVSIAYAKNVLFAKNKAKIADAGVKNMMAEKKEQNKKHTVALWDLREKIILYVQADEALIIKRKVTPSGGLYEKVHETDVKWALSQWDIALPPEFFIQKGVWDSVWVQKTTMTWEKKKINLTFTIKESIY
jgi:ribosomal protein L9